MNAATRTRDEDLTHAPRRHCWQRLLGFHDRLATQMLALPWWRAIGFDDVPRHWSPRLTQDLRVLADLEQASAALPHGEPLPPLTKQAQHSGCLDGIDGATLGESWLQGFASCALSVLDETSGLTRT